MATDAAIHHVDHSDDGHGHPPSVAARFALSGCGDRAGLGQRHRSAVRRANWRCRWGLGGSVARGGGGGEEEHYDGR